MNRSISPPDSPAILDDCPLPASVQWRNIACFVSYWCVFYFCAPVTYVGLTHANLLRTLGNSDTVCNLPQAVYVWLTIIPVIVAWTFSHPRFIKPLILFSIMAMSSATAMVAFLLWNDFSAPLRSYAVIAHGAIFGSASGVLLTALWDALRRGVSTSRRGAALGFTFGCGPICACIGSLFQDAAFNGKLTGGYTFGLVFPLNYCALFAAATPLLLGAGIVMALFKIPPAAETETIAGTPVTEVVAGFKQFLRNRVVWYTILIYVLVYSGGNAIFANVSLHAETALNQIELGTQTDTQGLQSFLRFGCKALAGMLLGLLLASASPRATLVATTAVLLLGMTWALSTTGWWFMATFGLLGAGELFGAYFPNYVTTASEKKFVRINMAYLSLLSVFIGFSSVAFGMISDNYGRIASFYLSAAMLSLALCMIAFLPANPTPRDVTPQVEPQG